MNLPLDGSGAAFGAEDVPLSMFNLNHFPAVDSVLFSKHRQQN